MQTDSCVPAELMTTDTVADTPQLMTVDDMGDLETDSCNAAVQSLTADMETDRNSSGDIATAVIKVPEYAIDDGKKMSLLGRRCRPHFLLIFAIRLLFQFNIGLNVINRKFSRRTGISLHAANVLRRH